MGRNAADHENLLSAIAAKSHDPSLHAAIDGLTREIRNLREAVEMLIEAARQPRAKEGE
jgi:hypothetical protein